MLFKKHIVLVSITAIAALAMISILPRFSARAQSANSLGTDPIVGCWHVTVSFDNGRPDVSALWTFNRDRTFTMAGSWPGQFGPGHGVWSENDDSNPGINLTFFRLLYTPTETNEVTSALAATFNGTLKVQNRLTVSDDGQSFTGNWMLTNFDAAANVRFTRTGSVNATRIVVEPLP